MLTRRHRGINSAHCSNLISFYVSYRWRRRRRRQAEVNTVLDSAMLSSVLHTVVEDRPVDHVGGRDARSRREVCRTRAGCHHLQRRETVCRRGQGGGDGGDGFQLPTTVKLKLLDLIYEIEKFWYKRIIFSCTNNSLCTRTLFLLNKIITSFYVSVQCFFALFIFLTYFTCIYI